MIVGGLWSNIYLSYKEASRSNIYLSYKEASRSNIWEEMDNLC